MKLLRLGFSICISLIILSLQSNAQVFDVNDPIVDYDENNPPITPPYNVISKWVRTPGVSWNTDDWKCYYISGMPFRLRFPVNYDPNRPEKYPMLILLHGLGFQNGTIYMNERHLNNAGADRINSEINNGRYEGFVLSAQASSGWFNTVHLNLIHIILDQANQELNLDLDRVVVNGRSGGAQQVWDFISWAPKTFAAAMPMSGLKTPEIDDVKHMPIWVFQGGRDQAPAPSATENVINQIVASSGNVKYTLFKNGGHGIFNNAYREDDFFNFILGQHKANPHVLNGDYVQVYDDSGKAVYEFVENFEPCPGDVINFTIGVTAGFDGYEWRKDGVLINGATGNEITVTETGVYDVRIFRGGSWSVWSPKPIEVSIKEETNTPDIQLVDNESVVLPSLDGSTDVELELPFGFAAYEWRQLPENNVIGSERTITVSESGDYVAQVTENFGCSSNDSNPFTIIDANGPNRPAEPLAFNGSALSKTEISLFWTSDPNDPNPASHFELFRARESEPLEFLDLLPASELTYLDIGLEPNTNYRYEIRAYNDSGASGGVESSVIKTQVDSKSPTAPTNLTIIDQNTYSVSLDWDESSDDVGVYKYDVYKEGVKVKSVDSSEAMVYNLLPNQIYRFYVKARDVTGNESAKSERVMVVTSANSNAEAAFSFDNHVNDVTGNGTNISINGNPTYSTSDVMEGMASLSFDGTGDYLDLDVNNRFIHGEFTERSVAFWMKSLDLNGTHDIYDEGGSTNGFGIRTVGNVLDFSVQDNHDIQSVTSSSLVSDTWYHVAAIFNNGTMSLFINGEEVGRKEDLLYDHVSQHTDAGGLGATNGSNAFDQNGSNFVGLIDDFQIFGTVLDYNDVQQLFNPEDPVEVPNEYVEAPSEITATVLSYESIEVNWIDNSNNEVEFRILRSQGFGNFLPIASVAENTTTFIDTGLEPSTEYFYQVVALSEYNESEMPVTVIPSIGNLKFDNDISDSSGNNLDSQVSGNITFSDTDLIEGDYSAYFNGSSYIDLDRGNEFIHDAFSTRTVAFWFKSTIVGGIQDIYDEGGATNGIGVRLNGNVIDLTVQNGHNIVSLTAPITRNVWHHFVGIFDNGSLRIYIDGVLAADRNDVAYSTVNSHGNGGGLGGTNGSNAFDTVSDRFEGYLDDFYVFGDARDDLVGTLSTVVSDASYATTLPLPTVPEMVQDLSVDNVGHFNVDISFTDQSSNEDYFELLRSINTESNYQVVASFNDTSDGVVNYVDQDVSPNISYYYKVLAVNAGGSTESSSVTATALNHTPVINSISDVTMRFDTTVDIQIFVTDEDDNDISIDAPGAPEFSTLTDYGDGSALLRLSPSELDNGFNFPIEVEAVDEFGGSTNMMFNLLVDANHLPVLSGIDDIVLSEGAFVSLDVLVEDEDGDELIWGTTLPDFVSLAVNVDGNATLEISPGFIDHGVYQCELTVDDQQGGSVTKDFMITVEDVELNTNVLVNFTAITYAETPWNNITSVGEQELMNTEGAASGISLELMTDSWLAYQLGAQSGDDSGAFPDAVLQDYYFFGMFGGPETVDLRVSGLTVGIPYDFSFVASSVWNGVADNGTTVYTSNGVSASVYSQGNTEETADLVGLLPDANGEIIVTMSMADDGTPIGYVNGFSISSSFGENEVPAVPTDLSASLIDSQVHLSWRDAPYNENGFNIYRSTGDNSSYALIGTVSSNEESFVDSNLTQGDEYFYVVTAFNGVGESVYSNEASYLIPDTPPSIVLEAISSAYVDQTTIVNFTVSDEPLNIFSTSVENLPEFGVFTDNGSGGSITLTPSIGHLGDYTITIRAVDNQGQESTEVLNFSVLEEQLYSIALNFSDNSIEPSPWNNTAKAPAVNDSFNNLIDDSGIATSVSVTLETAFGNVFNLGSTTGDNSGVVPDNVLQEYYWWGFNGATSNTMQLRVSGLDQSNKYSFKFVGSSEYYGSGITDNGETDYSIGNKTVSVDVDANTDRIGVISNVVADDNGEVVVTMTLGEGAVIGYINGMIIEAYPTNPGTFNPSDLVATPLDQSSIQLSWVDNSIDELGFEVEKSSDPSGPFSYHSTVSANETSLTDSGLTQGSVHYYRVRAIYAGGGYSDYTEVAYGTTIAFYVYVNINGEPAYDEPMPWNNLSVEYTTGSIVPDFHNQDGNPTGIGMEVVYGMHGSSWWGTTTNANSGLYPDNVMRSIYFNDKFEPSGKFKLTGLDQGYNYNLKFMGGISTEFISPTLYVASEFKVGNEVVSQYQVDNISEAVAINNIEPSELGEILFEVTEVPGSQWAIFSAFVVEAYPKDASENPGARFIDFESEEKEALLTSSMLDFYPNPVNRGLNIEVSNAESDGLKFTLVDLNGKIILSKEYVIESNEGTYKVEEDLSWIQDGIYMISIQSGSQVVWDKLIKK